MKKKGALSLPDVTSSALSPIRESYCFLRAGKKNFFVATMKEKVEAEPDGLWSSNVKRSKKKSKMNGTTTTTHKIFPLKTIPSSRKRYTSVITYGDGKKKIQEDGSVRYIRSVPYPIFSRLCQRASVGHLLFSREDNGRNRQWTFRSVFFLSLSWLVRLLNYIFGRRQRVRQFFLSFRHCHRLPVVPCNDVISFSYSPFRRNTQSVHETGK